MSAQKFIYKNADGLDQEHSPSVDSLQLFSLLTATKELTDAKLANLIDGAEANDQHIHDVRYYRKNQHVSTSTGTGTGAAPVQLKTNGLLDNSLVDVTGLNPLLSHSNLMASSLLNDDHPQYIRVDGTRDHTGVQSYSTLVSITADKNIPTKYYVDQAILTANLGQEWYDSVLTRIITPPASPSAGSRYLIDATLGTPTGVWAGHSNQVATWSGTAYTYQTPTTGTFVPVDNETTVLYYYGGSAWTTKSFEVTTASTGIIKSGVDIQLDPNSAGNGLSFASGVYNVNVDGTGLQIVTDILSIKALGVKAANIDFGTGAAQTSGVNIPLADAGAYFATKNVEFALQQIAENQLNRGVNYTAGSGGVKLGDLVYISANDTVLPLVTIANNNICIGVALSAVAAGGTVKVLGFNAFLKGALTGATAGTPYYWTGTGYSTSAPTALGANVWQVGIAKNATDLNVRVDYIKKVSLLG